MGLDMYAYTAQADLVGDDQVDIDITARAMARAGFSVMDDETFDSLNQTEKSAYWARRDQALEKCKEEGLLNTDFAYWRKFNILHGWMERLYREKGGTQESFNCTTVRLDPADLDRLEADARSGENLPVTKGFFFGGDEAFDVEDREEILNFIERAGEAQDAGLVVLYNSWW